MPPNSHLLGKPQRRTIPLQPLISKTFTHPLSLPNFHNNCFRETPIQRSLLEELLSQYLPPGRATAVPGTPPRKILPSPAASGSRCGLGPRQLLAIILILSGLFTVNPSEHGACLQVPHYTARGTPPSPLGFQWLHQPQPTRLPVRKTQLPAPSPRAGLKLVPWGNCTAADLSEDACAPRPGWGGCWRHPVGYYREVSDPEGSAGIPSPAPNWSLGRERRRRGAQPRLCARTASGCRAVCWWPAFLQPGAGAAPPHESAGRRGGPADPRGAG